MKEIVFRAKSEETGQWLEGCPTRNRASWYICDYDGSSHLVRPSTVCEWTGARDLFGKKIFEQDILKSPSSTSYWRVTFDDGRFVAIRLSDRKALTIKDSNINHYQMVVIGNAYDTPDLLCDE